MSFYKLFLPDEEGKEERTDIYGKPLEEVQQVKERKEHKDKEKEDVSTT